MTCARKELDEPTPSSRQPRGRVGAARAPHQGPEARRSASSGSWRPRSTLAGAEGIGAVSMGRVAGELGSSPMSLYRYVDAKDELLALMVDAALGPVPPPAGGRGLARRPHALGVGLPRRAAAATRGRYRSRSAARR